MGLLEKLTARPPQLTPPLTAPTPAVPSEPCHAGHQPSAGTTWWLDPYGRWNCLDCTPPAAEAFVRDWVYVGGDLVEANKEPIAEGLFKIAPGFEIVAVSRPGGGWLFNPATAQARRREAVECVEWFDRCDARGNNKKIHIRKGFGG